MKHSMHSWDLLEDWRDHGEVVPAPDLVLYFAGQAARKLIDPWAHFHKRFPKAHVLGCTSAGEILGQHVEDDTLVAAAIKFDRTRIRLAKSSVATARGSQEAGHELAQALADTDLKAVFVLADGLVTNGDDLVEGLRAVLPEQVMLTGGLASDGADFKSTQVGCDGPLEPGIVAAVGFYGESIRVGWGSVGGWRPHGEVHRITRAAHNVLYELDGEPALQLYKKYLGTRARDLPSSGLLFPLAIWAGDDDTRYTVRTIIGVNESSNSLIFAGTMPEGHGARLMRADFSDLVSGAAAAGKHASQPGAEGLALLISCIGRKLLLTQSSHEEVRAVSAALGERFQTLGFYSYGEIAPNAFTSRCGLHNQTMTVTTLSELS